MKRTVLELLAVCTCGTALCGCVAIPCGTETFTTEFPSAIRATEEKPAKSYEPSVAATSGSDGIVDIGLSGTITTTQTRVQHYSSVSLTKRRRLAIGLYADSAEKIYRPKDALVPMYIPYVGNGRYASDTFGYEMPGSYTAGILLNGLSLGLLPMPFTFLHGIFGPFDHDRHFLGKTLETSSKMTGPKTLTTNRTHDSRDLELLELFSAEDRQRIGVWTCLDDAEHPQNTFWLGFSSRFGFWPWPVVFKYCTYVVHDPVELERTTPAAPQTTMERRPIPGPYGVFLRIPDVDFTRTLVVPRGETVVRFDLGDAVRGNSDGQAYVRFLPPSGGLEEAWDDDARVLLESVQGKDFSVDLQLPLPRLTGGTP